MGFVPSRSRRRVRGPDLARGSYAASGFQLATEGPAEVRTRLWRQRPYRDPGPKSRGLLSHLTSRQMAGAAAVCDRAFGFALRLMVCAALSGTSALAQTESLEQPRRLDPKDVPYPKAARGSAEVLLEVVIDRDGTVAESSVVSGIEPFADAARSAVVSWRFTPAVRDGKPITARIRVKVDFTPPSSAVAPSTAVAASPAQVTTVAVSSAASVAEVTVHGVRPAPGGQQMTSGDVRQMPGSFGDAFRAIEALPGVIPILSGFPYFLVRGAPPGNTGSFIDGVNVPTLFHLGIGAAVIHPGLIDRVDLYPGGYPARFGRFAGGILTGDVSPPPERLHGEASVRLLDAGALVATPVSGGQGDVLISGRYGYPGPLLSLFAPQDSLAYWDYQTRLRWRVSDHDEVGSFIFGSFDSLSTRASATGALSELLGMQFHRADLRWDHRTDSTGSIRVALTLGYNRSATSDPSQTGLLDYVENEKVGLRTEWIGRPIRQAEVRVGGDVTVEPYVVRIPVPNQGSSLGTNSLGLSAANFAQTDANAGVYGEATWRPAPHVELRPGLRVDAFTSRAPATGTLIGGTGTALYAKGGVDPRLGLRWEMTRSLAWVTALGVAHQASNIPLPVPGLQFSELSRGLQSAFQYSTGAEVQLPADFTASGDAFMHAYTGLADFLDTCPRGETTCTFDGRAVGLEFLVRRPLTQQVSGWASYTLSRADRDAYYDGAWMRRVSEFDRTHVVNLVLAADLGRRWRAGARLLAYSGLPYSSLTGMVGPPDARGPAFYRLDWRLEKRWNALGGTMAIVFEWLNVLLSKEALGTTCSLENGSPRCVPNMIGPITFPSVGLEAAW
jgi:TonB family protein